MVIGDSFKPKDINFKKDPVNWLYFAGGAISVAECKTLALKSGFKKHDFIRVKNNRIHKNEIAGYLYGCFLSQIPLKGLYDFLLLVYIELEGYVF